MLYRRRLRENLERQLAASLRENRKLRQRCVENDWARAALAQLHRRDTRKALRQLQDNLRRTGVKLAGLVEEHAQLASDVLELIQVGEEVVVACLPSLGS